MRKFLQMKYISALVWIVAFQLISFFMGMLSRRGMEGWYDTLHKSILTPPDYVFPIAWTILYIALALAGWSLWRNRDTFKKQLLFGLYALQLGLNFTWTLIFFSGHMIGTALIWLIVMTLVTAILILFAFNHNRFAAWLLVPYFCWIAFASYLNLVIWLFN